MEGVRKPKTMGELDEAARELSRASGWGYERSMVELMRRDRAQIAMEALTQAAQVMAPLVEAISAAARRAGELFAGLAEALQPADMQRTLHAVPEDPTN